MRFRRSAVVIFTSLLAMIGTIVVIAPASFAGTGTLCDNESTQVCMSMNGVAGHYVYGKAQAGDSAEEITEDLRGICHGQAVVTNTCPFPLGSHLNSKYAGNDIVQFTNNNPGFGGLNIDGRATFNVVQGEGLPGTYWVADTLDTGGYDGYLVNITVSSEVGAPVIACSTGMNDPINLTEHSLGGGACLWYGLY